MVTGVSPTHCCRRCAQQPGEHGVACHQRQPPDRLKEEFATALRHRFLKYLVGRRLAEPSQTPSLDRCAYAVLLYGADAEYALGALLVATSLRRTGAQAKLVLLHTADVPASRLELLRQFFDEVRLIADPVRLPDDSPLCACARDFGHPQFLKLHLLELDFDKVLYLDCDILVRRNLDGLFELPPPAAMDRLMPMPPHGAKLPNRVLLGRARLRGIQGGVMLLAPDRARFESMRQDVEGWRAGGNLGDYVPSIGNEQDYLTWKYCEGRLEEDGHASVWTHLGCEYNYEVHEASTYYGVGRERWLWLDYERDAALFHFSALARKRGKHLLQNGNGRAHCETDAGGDVDLQDPRVAFAQREWDLEVERLRGDVATMGVDLAAWLGEGKEAHTAHFAILDRGRESGMEILQLENAGDTSGTTAVVGPPQGGEGLIFEAFTANCADGLIFFPPGFTPGPPWGVCFWALRAPTPHAQLCEEPRASSQQGPLVDSAEGIDLLSGALAEVGAEPLVACSCSQKLAGGEPRPRQQEAPDGLDAVGAWLRSRGAGGERWVFGLLSEPPHLPGCRAWRLTTAFRVKVLRHGVEVPCREV